MPRLNVAILGSGNIGTDLLIKTMRSSLLRCVLFVGRNLQSSGLAKAGSLGVPISWRGIEAIVEKPHICDLVFDATSALDHQTHWPILDRLGKIVVDMTPARLGAMCVPAVNRDSCLEKRNINMVTCGGQAAIPLACAIRQSHRDVSYVEIVSSIAARSAGPATRINLDEYVETTEKALVALSGCRRSKAILILNPADPCINMQTTLFAKVAQPNLERCRAAVAVMEKKVQDYVPGYQVIVPPIYENGRIVIMVRVQGSGDHLPTYAGNLDIIDCAAVAMAEAIARKHFHVTPQTKNGPGL